MKHSENEGVWNLDSGTWHSSSKHNYILSGFLSEGGFSEKKYNLFKQMYHSLVDGESQEIFPPEFKYHPETGRDLKRIYSFKHDDVWISPYGQRSFLGNENRKDHGLQYSQQLKVLKNNAQKTSDNAQKEIPFSFGGSMEFFSICIGTDVPQLVALNKSKGDIYLLLELSNTWEKINAVSSLLESCPETWQDYWGVESSYDVIKKQHFLYLPTKQGLAELSIDGEKLTYKVTYTGSGPCLGKPIYWNNCIYVPIDNKGKVEIWNQSNNCFLPMLEGVTPHDFNQVVFDSRNLMWLSILGKCHLTLDKEQHVSAKFSQWLPIYQPDFNFGPPFFDKEEDIFQLCWKNLEGDDASRIYLRLNSEHIIEKQTNSPRFTTGSTSYDFEEKISNRQNKANIWDIAKKNEHVSLLVPLMEDQSSDRDLVLGICFKDVGSRSKESILMDSSKHFVSLFMDTPNEGVHHFFSGQFSDPIKKSRFFYHRDYLYFYHPELSKLQGWEVVIT